MVLRFNWYQMESGGAFYIKAWEDDNGAPGGEIYSRIVNNGMRMVGNESHPNIPNN